MPAATADQLLTIDDVRKRLVCSRQHVHRLIEDGRLAAIKDGRFVRVEERELAAYIAACRTIKPEPKKKTNRR